MGQVVWAGMVLALAPHCNGPYNLRAMTRSAESVSTSAKDGASKALVDRLVTSALSLKWLGSGALKLESAIEMFAMLRKLQISVMQTDWSHVAAMGNCIAMLWRCCQTICIRKRSTIAVNTNQPPHPLLRWPALKGHTFEAGLVLLSAGTASLTDAETRRSAGGASSRAKTVSGIACA